MRRASVTLPCLCACTGMLTFAAMDALMKGLSISAGAYNAMLWRVAAGALIGGCLYLATRARRPSRAAMRLHLLRGAIATAMLLAYFWGIARVPLAEGTALTFIAPLLALYLAALLLHERIGRGAILASLLGFAGMLVIVAGRLHLAHGTDALRGVGAILLSALLYAYNLILQRRQAQIATPLEIAFFQNIVVLALLALPAPFIATLPTPAQLPAVAGSATLAFASLMLLSWAYARAEAQVLLSVEYTAFAWAALLGWLMFDERLTASTLAGTALIVTGCIIAARSQPAASPRPDPSET